MKFVWLKLALGAAVILFSIILLAICLGLGSLGQGGGQIDTGGGLTDTAFLIDDCDDFSHEGTYFP